MLSPKLNHSFSFWAYSMICFLGSHPFFCSGHILLSNHFIIVNMFHLECELPAELWVFYFLFFLLGLLPLLWSLSCSVSWQSILLSTVWFADTVLSFSLSSASPILSININITDSICLIKSYIIFNTKVWLQMSTVTLLCFKTLHVQCRYLNKRITQIYWQVISCQVTKFLKDSLCGLSRHNFITWNCKSSHKHGDFYIV